MVVSLTDAVYPLIKLTRPSVGDRQLSLASLCELWLGLPKTETLYINPKRRSVDSLVTYPDGKLGKDSRGGTNKLGR